MISNDTDFKQTLEKLELPQQRRVGAAFVRNVLALNLSLSKVVETAADEDVSAEELAIAFKQAKAAALESHTRCGSDSDWQAQAGYFVARAASALVAPDKQAKNPAWEAAASARMARTCGHIDAADESMHEESEAQYRLLEQFLNDI
ncbi:MAG: hypothetical protein PHE17_00925 [Thiothrix sp.]|jgi:hypothetical protein|uniref:hypothetical protein n=1 Tax=Thiothrix sp. TaxID=1032 RepID=UPI00262AB428|nr:hypothetical protein [Thiothrix sp.]MDD5391557.1 hypothetical protein [Thiothrix sp.]